MAEPAIDFKCYVAPYEVRRQEELSNRNKKGEKANVPGMPYLVRVGPSKLVKARPEALTKAVDLLLLVRMPKWHADIGRIHQELKDSWGSRAQRRKAIKKALSTIEIDHDEFAALEKVVLAISRQLGRLREYPPGKVGPSQAPSGESFKNWIDLADLIQRMFKGQGDHRRLNQDLEHPFGRLTVYLSFKSGVASMQLRPDTTRAALIHCAAQRVAKGASLQTCKHCGSPFVSGGEAGPSKKKRGGAQFCSNKCRSSYHNELRRKAARKAKL
jgi:hypothetical protein